jgi:hypothetical protein
VQKHFAIDLEGRDRRDARHQREQDEVHRQAPDIADLERTFVGRIAREVAEVQVERREVGHPDRGHGRQGLDGAGHARHAGVLGLFEQHVHGDVGGQRDAARLDDKVDRQDQHHDPDRRAGPVLEPSHRLHAALDDE